MGITLVATEGSLSLTQDTGCEKRTLSKTMLMAGLGRARGKHLLIFFTGGKYDWNEPFHSGTSSIQHVLNMNVYCGAVVCAVADSVFPGTTAFCRLTCCCRFRVSRDYRLLPTYVLLQIPCFQGLPPFADLRAVADSVFPGTTAFCRLTCCCRFRVSWDYSLLPTYVLLQIPCFQGLQPFADLRAVADSVLLRSRFAAEPSSLQTGLCCRGGVVADSVSTFSRLFAGYLLFCRCVFLADSVLSHILRYCSFGVVAYFALLQIRCCRIFCVIAASVLSHILRCCRFGVFAYFALLQIRCCRIFCVVADSVLLQILFPQTVGFFPDSLLLQSVSLRVGVVANYVLLQILCCSRVVVVAKYVSLQIRCCWRCCLLAHSPNGRPLMARVLSHVVRLQIKCHCITCFVAEFVLLICVAEVFVLLPSKYVRPIMFRT